MKQQKRHKSPDFGYVTVKTLPHFGELAVPHKIRRKNEAGQIEREFILLDCKHGDHTTFLTRADI